MRSGEDHDFRNIIIILIVIFGLAWLVLGKSPDDLFAGFGG